MKCPHHKSVPFLIILLGLDFLAFNMGWVNDSFLNISWPILVIAIGFTKLGACKCDTK